MNPFEMVAIIVGITIAAGFLKHAIDAKYARSDSIDQELMQQVSQLEARLEVLEKIVTSDGYDLKQRFKDL